MGRTERGQSRGGVDKHYFDITTKNELLVRNMNLQKIMILLMMCKHVFVDVDGVYSLLVAVKTEILKFPVDISQTPLKPGQPTVVIPGGGNE